MGELRPRWTEAEDAVIREFYPLRRVDKIIAALPARTRLAICTRAHNLGVFMLPAIDVPEKRCPRCGNWLPMSMYRSRCGGTGTIIPASTCNVCVRKVSLDWNRKWRVANPEKYAEANRRSLLRKAKKVKEHPEITRAHSNNYHRNRMLVDPQYAFARQMTAIRRRTAMRAVECTLTVDEWIEIVAKFDGACAYCGSTDSITVDHVIPISKGGPHSRDNVVPACKSCNSSKNTRSLPEWIERMKAAGIDHPLTKKESEK